MGNSFCLKNEQKNFYENENKENEKKNENEKIKDIEYENEDESENENENENEEDLEIETKDLTEKRKLAEYLISNDYNIIKRYLPEVQKLNDKQFNKLFEGKTDYKKYNVSNQKNFIQLVSKFDDNQELIMEWYNKEDYYKFILEIWKTNIIPKLKEAENQNEKDEILKSLKIDISKWDEEFREYFNKIINISPINILAKKIKGDYKDLNELIKNVEKCKKNLEKNKELICMKFIKANLDTLINKIIDKFISHFLKKLLKGYDKFFDEIKKKREKKAILKILNVKEEYENDEKINNFKLSEKNRKQLINTIIKINKNDYDFLFNNEDMNFNEEYEKLKELQNKFNKEKESSEMNIGEKEKILYDNVMMKNIILCLNIIKIGYKVLNISKIIPNYEGFGNISEIKKNFLNHQNAVNLISDNLNEAIEETINNEKNFQKDLDDLQNIQK